MTKTPGTGPYELISYKVGKSASVRRRKDFTWFGGETYLDGVDWTDYGSDASNPAIGSAFEAGEIDCNYQTVGGTVDLYDSMGLVKESVVTAGTIVLRTNVTNKPYDDKRVRNAIQLAVDNETVLKLGYSDLGQVAENHHVCPIHPEYYELPKVPRDLAKAKALMTEAGQMDHEFELISYDADYVKDPADVVAAQLREAGIKVKRTIIPGTSFWNDWTKYPWSTTEWGMRPLGVQVLALAYRSGEAWNETRLCQSRLRQEAQRSTGRRRPGQAQGTDEGHRVHPPGLGRPRSVVLAFALPSPRRLCEEPQDASDLRTAAGQGLARQGVDRR